MSAVSVRPDSLSRREACVALGLSRATFYRELERSSTPSRSAKTDELRQRSASPRALSAQERQEVLDVLHEPRFCDLAVPQVYAKILDEGRYLCSARTMSRILGAQGEVRERRDQLVRPQYAKPELLATGPNQVWSWDITKLRGPRKWTYFYLYVVMDIFSRYAVGWMLASRESAELAKQLWEETLSKHAIQPGQIVAHSDRGAPMKSKSLAELFADLGVAQSFSRPHVSDDNPYSEAQFRTMKYRPDYPDRFDSHEAAHMHCVDFFDWYHHEHRHSALAWMTPADIHYGRAEAIDLRRADTLAAAYRDHPERFVRAQPKPPALPEAVWINPPRPTP